MTDLNALMAKLKEKRGTPEQWLDASMAVTRYVAGLDDRTRVFCRGEVHTHTRHFPAVLTYSAVNGTIACAPSGDGYAIEAHHASTFWSGIPHAAIAREVLDGAETKPLTPEQEASR